MNVLAAVCRICPLCIAKRQWPDSRFAKFMGAIEKYCPFCRAYDRQAQQPHE